MLLFFEGWRGSAKMYCFPPFCTKIYVAFLISPQKHTLWFLVEVLCWDTSNESLRSWKYNDLWIQSTLIISTSLISNNRLSWSEILVPVLTWKSKNRYQNIMEKRRNCSSGAISPLFHNIFNISLNFWSQITYSFIKCGCSIYCFRQFHKSDMWRYGYLEVWISRSISESPLDWDNESWLYHIYPLYLYMHLSKQCRPRSFGSQRTSFMHLLRNLKLSWVTDIQNCSGHPFWEIFLFLHENM